jgi:excisionase family DNA binding protein
MSSALLVAVTDDDVRLYSVTKAAELLGVHRSWLYRQIGAGLLPVVELGSTRAKTRIKATDLRDFIASRTHPAVAS